MNDLLPGLDAAPNIHPLFVHFPIALWAMAALLWALAVIRRGDELFTAGRWVLYAASLTAIAAAITGLRAGDQLGHESADHALVHVHRNYMLVATVLGIGVTVAAYLLRRRTANRVRLTLLVALLATNVVSSLGADRGVAVVYGVLVGS